MNVELSDLGARAARHAALADPARLWIADLLSLGDRSPRELQLALGISSSLLAHHLGVLEHAGIVTRRRSDADRRRSYVRLVPDAVAELAPNARAAARRVVFVCTANSARSQLAEAIWTTASPIPCASGGTHPAAEIEPGALAAAARHGLPLSPKRPRAFADVAEASDVVVTVCDRAHEELALPMAIHWSIADPVASGSPAAFDVALEEIRERVSRLAPRIAALA